MTTTIGISLASQHCHIVVMQKHENTVSYLAKKTLDTGYNDKKTLAALHPFYKKQTSLIVGIPIAQTMMQQLTLDAALMDDEIIHYLTHQIESLFGQKADTLYWDYQMQTKSNQQQTITLVATHKQYLIALENAFSRANLSITAIEPDAFALARAIKTEDISYGLILREDYFLLITSNKGILTHCETGSLSCDSKQLSALASRIKPESCMNVIATQDDYAILPSIKTAFENQQITFKSTLVSPYIIAENLCNWSQYD